MDDQQHSQHSSDGLQCLTVKNTILEKLQYLYSNLVAAIMIWFVVSHGESLESR
jgi:hypothetical protein